MVTHPALQQPVIDAVDIRSVAEFYRELLGLHYRAGDELADGREPDSAARTGSCCWTTTAAAS